MTINEAIAKVLTTQFKKDMGEALEIVENAGFVVRKISGGYEVYNPETDREIFISYGNRYCNNPYVRYGLWNNRRYGYDWKMEKLLKFDFEGNLRKPLNRAWYERRNMEENEERTSRIRRKYEELQSAKWHVKYEMDRIARAKKEMERLQKEIIDATRSQVRAEQNLENTRKALRLKK